jgi:hypothetical protein
MQSRGNSIVWPRYSFESLDPGSFIHGPNCFQKSPWTSFRVSSGSTENSCLVRNLALSRRRSVKRANLQRKDPSGPNLPLTAGLRVSLQKLPLQSAISIQLFKRIRKFILEPARPEDVVYLFRCVTSLPKWKIGMCLRCWRCNLEVDGHPCSYIIVPAKRNNENFFQE